MATYLLTWKMYLYMILGHEYCEKVVGGGVGFSLNSISNPIDRLNRDQFRCPQMEGPIKTRGEDPHGIGPTKELIVHLEVHPTIYVPVGASHGQT